MEAFEKVAKEDAGTLSIVQRIVLKSTDYLRRIIAPAGGQGGVTMSYLYKLQQFSPGRLRVLRFSWQGALQLAVRDLCWWCKQATVPVASQAKVFKTQSAKREPRGVNQGRSRGIDARELGEWTPRNRVSMLITLRKTDGDHLFLMRTGMPSAL